MSKGPLTLNSKDSAGVACPYQYVSKQFLHFKTKKLYRVVGYRFDAERDLWLIDYEPVHKEKVENGMVEDYICEDFSRSVRNFLDDDPATNMPRFIEVR